MTGGVTPYQHLTRRFARLSALEDTLALLDWDRATMLQPGSFEGRSRQTAVIAGLHHELLTEPMVGEWLAAADPDGLDSWQSGNLREMRRIHAHAVAVPTELVEAMARVTALCESAWRGAKTENRFDLVAPSLSDLIVLVRESAQAKGEALGLDPYDALLDQYQPGLRIATIEAWFDDLAAFLPDLLRHALESQPPPPPLPAGPFPVNLQERLSRALMQRLGFDFSRGRLDVSRHPFCGGAPWDLRLTSRPAEDDFFSNLMAVIHETGHALYELGLPAAHLDQPVGRARGMAVHESQSLLIEMIAGRSLAFQHQLSRLARDTLGADGPGWSGASFAARAQRVSPGLIRVDADEVTYPFHVILRTRLERDLLSGALRVADLPEAFREGMRDLLGIVPADDATGCLQDIHWYDGAFGYFPTYTVGAMLAAQIDAALRQDVPDLDDNLAHARFEPLLDWVRARVHGQGCRLELDELVEQATGGPLATDALKRHLTRRYAN